MQNLTNDIFKTIEAVENFKADIDLMRFCLASAVPVSGTALISAEKARLAMINRFNKDKRFKKLAQMSENQTAIVAANSTADLIEVCAIYSTDKIVQLSQFLTGGAVYGAGKNNSLLYLIHAIDTYQSHAVLTTKELTALVNTYGQNLESSATQTSNGLTALKTLKCLNGGAGKYRVNENSALMSELLTRFGTSTRRNLAI